MNITIRPLTIEERKYTYAQLTQLEGQTGSIGHLRGDFGSGGNEFYTTWNEHNSRLKTPEFASELDKVINELRSSECELLKSRRSMVEYARQNTESGFKGSYTTEYGFRVDTEKYSYLLRCNPQKGDYNFYCFCYVAEWLDRHIKNAREDIRFIDSRYRDLFRLPDGERVTIELPDGKQFDMQCRYIDSMHVAVENDIFHICEFAERMERVGNRYAPTEPPLPPKCMSVLPDGQEMVILTRYHSEYIPVSVRGEGMTLRESVDALNDVMGVSKAQEAAMLAGVLKGWDTPAAKPKNYDENGKFIRHGDKER